MKKILTFILILIFFVLCAPTVFAEESDDFGEIKEQIDSRLKSSADKESADILEQEGISLTDPGSITGIKAENVFAKMWEYFTDALTKPIATLGKIIAALVICAVVKSMSPDKNEMGGLFETLCILSVIIIVAGTLSESFETVKSSVESINSFMISYVPIFAGTVTAGGAALSAGSYTAVMMLVCECMTAVAAKILVPFLSVILAATLVGAVNPKLRLSGTAESIKKCTVWILGTVMSVFVGLMTIQGMTGGAADSLAAKSLKFAASSFIPVIGRSVSDAYTAVRGSLGLIKSGVGSLGIIIIFIIVIRPVLAILAIKLMLWCGKTVGEILGENKIAQFLKSVNSIMSIGLSVIIAYAVVFIIATSTLMAAAIPS